MHARKPQRSPQEDLAALMLHSPELPGPPQPSFPRAASSSAPRSASQSAAGRPQGPSCPSLQDNHTSSQRTGAEIREVQESRGEHLSEALWAPNSSTYSRASTNSIHIAR